MVTGKRAKEIGMIDELGMMDEVMKAEFGDKVKIKDFSKGNKWQEFAQNFESSF